MRAQPGDLPLAGQHAIVTGGGRGIGAAIAAELARLGAHLSLIGRDRGRIEARGAALARDFRATVTPFSADVTDEGALGEAFAGAAHASGTAAILVNNAGGALSEPFLKTTPEQWQRMLDVNLTGAFLCARLALPGMIAAGYGRIVNVASTAGLVPYRYAAAYCAAKHGLIGARSPSSWRGPISPSMPCAPASRIPISSPRRYVTSRRRRAAQPIRRWPR